MTTRLCVCLGEGSGAAETNAKGSAASLKGGEGEGGRLRPAPAPAPPAACVDRLPVSDLFLAFPGILSVYFVGYTTAIAASAVDMPWR